MLKQKKNLCFSQDKPFHIIPCLMPSIASFVSFSFGMNVDECFRRVMRRKMEKNIENPICYQSLQQQEKNTIKYLYHFNNHVKK